VCVWCRCPCSCSCSWVVTRTAVGRVATHLREMPARFTTVMYLLAASAAEPTLVEDFPRGGTQVQEALANAQGRGDGPSRCPKRGFCFKTTGEMCTGLALFSSLRPWFYGWANLPANPEDYSKCTLQYDSGFVPMVWGGGTTPIVNMNVSAGAAALLGFNEPNHKKQSNMTGPQAAQLWPQVESLAKANYISRLISPAAAPCSDPDRCVGEAIDWFDAFFAACSGCKVDALATHSYVCNVSKLETYLTELHDRYRLPIWLTEYNCNIDHPTGQQLEYMQQAVPLLESLDFVEKYAWFEAPSDKFPMAGLIDNNTQLTQLGQWYRDAPC